MNTQSSYQPGHLIVEGTIRMFLVEILILPTGILITIFLTRRLGPADYGLFTLIATLVVLIKSCIASFFDRTTIKFISQTDDWRNMGNTIVQRYLAVGGVVAVTLWALAAPIAKLLNEPVLLQYLRIFSIDIFFGSFNFAHRAILSGSGRFDKRAIATSAYWLSRLIFIVCLVLMGFSVSGAILGSIAASLTELIIGCYFVRSNPFQLTRIPLPDFSKYTLPIFLFSISMLLYNKLDLFMLKILGGTAEQAGIYGAAQNLARLPGVIALSFSPVLLSILSRTLADKKHDLAVELGRNTMRGVIALLPLAGVIAGSAREIVVLIFGPTYLHAASLLSILIFAAISQTMIAVTAAIFTADGRPGLSFALTGPLLPVLIIAHLILIPSFGALGAAMATTIITGIGAVVTVFAVYRIWHFKSPAAILWRSISFSGLAFALAYLWKTPGFLLLLKLPAIGIVVAVAFLLTGELSAGEIAFFRSIHWRQPQLNNNIDRGKASWTVVMTFG